MRALSIGALSLAIACVDVGSAAAQASRRVVVQRPPVSQVRAALRAMGPQVQQCADRFEPWPNAGPRPRLRLRVWLEPEGRFTLDVPELDGRLDPSLPPRQRMNLTRLHACLRARVTVAVRHLLRPFRGRRQKIERPFRVTRPGPPPAAAELVRRVLGRRAALLACVPGAGASGQAQEMVIRATLGTDGAVRLTGLAVPDSVPFGAAARCVADEIGLVQVGRVTELRRFEAVLSYRLAAGPAAPE